MTLSKKPYRGTRDFFPAQKRVQNYLFSKMEKAAASFCYEPYNGPLLEEVDLYKAKSGDELINEQIYSFKDRGDRFVAIRPEMTPTLARMVSHIHREEAKPIRWYSIPNLMRYEKPQRGRLREHWQFNCDIFGAPGLHGEAEIIQLAVHLLLSFGATSEHFEILLNDRSIVDALFQNIIKSDPEQTYKLYKVIDKSKKVSQEAIEKMVDKVGIDQNQKTLFFNYLKVKSFTDLTDFLEKNEQAPAADRFKEFLSLCEVNDLSSYIKFDPTIVRGLDYYTGLVFEVFDKHPDNKRALCGGGAYGNLLKIFNEPNLAGVGFGLGDVTLQDFLQSHDLLGEHSNQSVDLLLTSQTENTYAPLSDLAKQARSHGLSVLFEFSPVKMKKAFNIAAKKGARFITLLGEDELSKGKVSIKDLKNQDQELFDLTDFDKIIQFLKR